MTDPVTPAAFASLQARFQAQSRTAQAYYSAMHAARQLLGSDAAADAWMNQPLPALNGATPAALVAHGQAETVLAHLQTLARQA